MWSRNVRLDKLSPSRILIHKVEIVSPEAFFLSFPFPSLLLSSLVFREEVIIPYDCLCQ